MRRPKIFFLVLAVAATGCLGESLDPDFDPDQPLPTLEAVPHAALGGAKIAFHRVGPEPVRYAGVYWIDGASGTSGGAQSGVADPSISSDGSRIAFRAPSGTVSQFDIWVSTLMGTDHQRLTDVQGTAEGPPSWTPDDAVVYPLWGNPTRIMRQPPIAASAAEQIASIAPVPGETCPSYLPGDGPLSVAPDMTLLFTCQWTAIYRYPPGGEPELLFQKPDAMGFIRQAVWSPDAQRIAFIEWVPTEQATAGKATVHVMNVGSSTTTVLATVNQPAGTRYYGDQSVASLCWSHDGSTIIFTAPEADLVSRVFAVPANGGTLTKITTAAGTSDGSVSCRRS